MLYLFGSQLEVRPVDRFSFLTQAMPTHARVCVWEFRWYCFLFRGSEPPNPNFGGIGRHFWAKCAKYWNLHVIKTTVSITTKFCTVMKTTKYSSRVVQICPKQTQGQLPSWKIEKSQYLHNSLTNFHGIWHCDASRHSGPCQPIKLHDLANSRGQTWWIFKNSWYIKNT